MPNEMEFPGIPTLSADGVADIPPLDAPLLETEHDDAPSTVEPPPKRRRRRKAKAAPEPAAPPPDDTERLRHLSAAIGAGFSVAGNILAQTRGAHWALTEQEVRTLGDVWAPALLPYMGSAGTYMPLLLAAVTTVGVVVPRVVADSSRPVLAPPAPQVQEVERSSLQEAPAPQEPAPVEPPPILPPPGRRAPGRREVSP